MRSIVDLLFALHRTVHRLSVAQARARARGITMPALLALVLVGLVLPGQSFAKTSRRAPQVAAPTTLRIGISQKWASLNPFLALLVSDYDIISLNYDLLVEPGANLQPKPGIATSWSTSNGGKTRTFKIRTGVTWSDGQPLTARDVAFTYNYILKSLTYKGGSYALSLFKDYLKYVTSVTAPNDTTVVVKSSKPDALLLSADIPILPQHIWSHVSYEAASESSKSIKPFTNQAMVGSGPFHLVQEVKDQYVRFVANKHYWGGTPRVNQVILQYFPDPGPMVQALRSGQIDVIDAVPPAEYGLLKHETNVKIIDGKPIATQEMGMNSWVPQPGQTHANPKQGSKGNPWLTKVAVRQALMYAVPKQQIVHTALLGYATAGQSIVPPTFPCSWQPTGGQTIGYSPAKAKSLLESLRFKDTDGDSYLNVPASAKSFDPKGTGKDFALRLYIRKNQPADLTAGQLIQQSMKRAGVKINLQVVDESPFLADATFPSATNADTDLYIWGWGGVFSPDPSVQVGRIGLTSQINAWQDANFSNPQFDALYAQQYSDVNQASRCGIEKKMQQLFYDKGAYSVLWYPDRLQAYRADRWRGFQLHDGAIFSALSYGPYNTLLNVSSIASSSNNSNTSTGPIIAGVVVIILVLIAIAAVVLYRRRARTDEVEDA